MTGMVAASGHCLSDAFCRDRKVMEAMRGGLPDGELRSRGFLDHDGIENRVYRTDVRLIKAGDVLRYDLSASASQAQTYINCTAGALVGDWDGN